jgi:hypothetical protein
MKNLHGYFENPFSNSNISLASLRAFADDFIENATSKPNAIVSPLVAPTQAALDAVSAGKTADETQLGERKGANLAKNTFRATLPALIGPIALKVQGQFGENSPEFTVCFPHGRTVFSHCRDEDLENELGSLVNGVTKYQTQLGAETVTATAALQDGWSAVWSPAKSAKGVKSGTKDVKNSARAALELQLFKNLLALVQAYPDQPGMLDVYMTPGLLMPHTPGSPAPTPPPTPAPVLSRDANGNWTLSYSGAAQNMWQIWARYEGSTNWSEFGEIQTSQFPSSDDAMSPGGAWWQVKVCGFLRRGAVITEGRPLPTSAVGMARRVVRFPRRR